MHSTVLCVALSEITDSGAVLSALEEFDAVGREAFLSNYGFGQATGYFVKVGGNPYDSKAIAGAAHGYQHGVPLTHEKFSGGDATVANKLEALEFEVTRPDRLPNWSVDELLLALDLYLRTRDTIGYGKGTKEVIELSNELDHCASSRNGCARTRSSATLPASRSN